MPMSSDAIRMILMQNKDKPFVRRILSPKDSPEVENPDGTYSTHSMAWAEADGKYVVYPTVLEDESGKLRRFDAKKAFEYARDSGNVIEFDSREEAANFSKDYKNVWE